MPFFKTTYVYVTFLLNMAFLNSPKCNNVNNTSRRKCIDLQSSMSTVFCFVTNIKQSRDFRDYNNVCCVNLSVLMLHVLINLTELT